MYSAHLKTKVLIIEDSAAQRLYLRDKLLEEGYEVYEASDGKEGLHICFSNPDIRLVITDLMMPEVDGYEFIKTIREKEIRYTYIIVVTSLERKDSIVKALSLGADDYLSKPIFHEELNLRLESAKRLLKLESQDELVLGLAVLAGYRSGETRSHLLRVREYCRILAFELINCCPELKLNRNWAEEMANVSPLHDIGKVGIGDSILHKPGKLNAQEYELIKTHTTIGGDLLNEIYEQTQSTFLLLAYEITLFHHERWDGKGYPCGLAKENIPLAARIVALADVYDALVSKRCYKKPYSFKKSKGIILSEKGKHFDPMVVDAFFKQENQFFEVTDRYAEESGENLDLVRAAP